MTKFHTILQEAIDGISKDDFFYDPGMWYNIIAKRTTVCGCLAGAWWHHKGKKISPFRESKIDQTYYDKPKMFDFLDDVRIGRKTSYLPEDTNMQIYRIWQNHGAYSIRTKKAVIEYLKNIIQETSDVDININEDDYE